MPINPFTEQGAFEPEATAAMGEAFDAACKELHDSGEPKMGAKSSPDELLRRHGKASLTRFA